VYNHPAPEEYDEKTLKKWNENTTEIVFLLKGVLNSLSTFTPESIESAFKEYLESENLGTGQVLPNFRLLVTGIGSGPSMFEIAALLGKEETINRIEVGLERLKSN